jgi:hypothetical protein
MKQRLQGIILGVLVTVLTAASITVVFAATRHQDIRVTFRDIRLVMNGVEHTPRDAFGNVVEPFIWDGTTYLPVRAVADALGLAVKWDEATSTVYLGARPSTSGEYRDALEAFLIQRPSLFSLGLRAADEFYSWRYGYLLTDAPLVYRVMPEVGWEWGWHVFDQHGNRATNADAFYRYGAVAERWAIKDIGHGAPVIVVSYLHETYGFSVLYRFIGGEYWETAFIYSMIPNLYLDGQGRLITRERDHEFVRYLHIQITPSGSVRTEVLPWTVSFGDGDVDVPGGPLIPILPLTALQEELTRIVSDVLFS